jgi:hypothetical protein
VVDKRDAHPKYSLEKREVRDKKEGKKTHGRVTLKKAVPWLRRLVAGLSPAQSVWDLWWAKWHWDRFFPEHFGFPLSISFHWCSITRKNEKINNLHHRVAQ